MTAADAASERILACPDCGMRQVVPAAPAGTTVSCRQCRKTFERSHGRSLTAAFALSLATLLLLLPANLAMLLRTDALGVSRESTLASAALSMLESGYPWLALVVFLFVVVFPLVRFGLLALVLGAVLRGRQHPKLGPAFRWACQLQTWAMLDVFLLGLAVAYARLADSVSVQIGVGAYCFVAAAVLSLFVRAALDEAAVWEAIAPALHAPPPGEALVCRHCELLVPADREGEGCPRCGAEIKRRNTESISRTIALTLAALMLYVPANIYPLATLPINYRPTTYTVLEGVIELAENKLWDLAILVFTASFAIPFLKLAGIAWCVSSVMRRSDRRLVAKTRTYRVVEEIGRWSMVDPFVIGAFVPVMNYNSLIYGRAEAAAVPFTAVVLLTIVGTKAFDPRLMWDAARRPR